VVQQDGEFASDRNDCSFLPILGASLHEPLSVSTEIAIWTERSENIVCAAHEKLAHQLVTGFGDGEL
jgi:hypothetical protein